MHGKPPKPTPSLPADGPFAPLAHDLRPTQLKAGEALPGWSLTVGRGTARLHFRRNLAPLH